MPEGCHIGPPATPAQWQAYFTLRWQVLRAPWDQPRGSECDALDAPPSAAIHCLVRDARDTALAVGRLQQDPQGQQTSARIRYMAVAEHCRGRGLGRTVLEYLECRARERGVESIELNAREATVGFYLHHGYTVTGKGPLLFGEIAHHRMHKRL